MINSVLFASILKPGPQTMHRSLENLLVAHVERVPADLLECLTAGSTIPGAVESWITMNEGFFQPTGAGLFKSTSTLTYALRPELPQLKVPTLFVWGEKDTFGSPTLGQEMAGLMPNGRCIAIPDAGHLVWLDQLELCAENISSFLAP
jgi:pimeloyl-ACP methyl ester carboxylesterase